MTMIVLNVFSPRTDSLVTVTAEPRVCLCLCACGVGQVYFHPSSISIVQDLVHTLFPANLLKSHKLCQHVNFLHN
jgi:hypothetical protein